MSSIFSDPFFRRGSTLLTGEAIELDDASNPIAGGEVVGQVKAFQDVLPTGSGERYSNRLCYCVAARYKGADVTDASTVAGEIYAFDANKNLTEFTNKATMANVNAELLYGVLDEHLTGKLRTNDIVWLVVKGPTQIKQTASAINAGSSVQVASGTAGSIAVKSSTNKSVGNIIGYIDATTGVLTYGNTPSGAQKVRVNLTSNAI